ncbi:MAG: 4-hydroxy-tetrahydrodipicolinate synthase [Legionellaceae bacterium]
MFYGSMVALVTPMKISGEIDFEALRQLIEFHIENKTDVLVVVGTTGESPTLNLEEKNQIIRVTVDQVKGRIPVIAGTGSNATRETIEATQQAMQAGVDACLLVTPYYNKPTQEGLFEHYSAIAKAIPIPQILYNVPSRTACDLLPETVERLSKLPNIIGIKEATGNLERLNLLLNLCGKKLDLYSGDDATAMEFILKGGKGVISVTANIAPKIMYNMCDAALKGDKEEAIRWNEKIQALHQELFIESNPIPIKWLLANEGLIPPGIRLPLTPLSSSNQALVQAAYNASLN